MNTFTENAYLRGVFNKPLTHDMMTVYDIAIRAYGLAIRLASPFNRKAAQWTRGRRGQWRRLEAFECGGGRLVWFHAASLGEFEQGRPVMERLREIEPRTRVLLTFFSPSGYEVRKDYKGADLVCYLPLDTAANALLKLFEEPDENTLFLLLCEDSGTLLKTIVSRTRTVYVPPVEPSAMAEFLQERYGRENPLCLPVAKAAGGDVIRAVDLMETRGAGDENFEWFAEIMRRCFYTDHLGLIQWAENMASLPRESQKGFLEYALNMLRESFMYSLQMDTVSYAYGREADFLRKFSPYVHHKNMETLTEAFEKAALHIRQNGNPKIVWTHFALSISKQIYKL